MPGYIRRTVTGTNYCGPGGYGEPLNEIDEACKAHDASYSAPYLYDYIESKEADEVFYTRLSRARARGWREHATKFVGKRYFATKLTLNEMRKNILDPNESMVMHAHAKKGRDHMASVKSKRALVVSARRDNPFLSYAHQAPGRWIRRAAPPLPYYRSRRFVGKTPRQPFMRFSTRRTRFRSLAKKLRFRRYRR